jgi:hypothetical protein
LLENFFDLIKIKPKSLLEKINWQNKYL